MRGKHKSKSIEVLVNEATLLAKNGVKELILIAQDLTYYGLDLYKKRELSSLLKELVKVDGIEWIRLHYAFPNGFPLDVLEVIKQEEKVCNYIDIPLQHISTKILKSMRRGSKKENIIELINKMRLLNPEIAIRTTVIVGYPGESEEDFNELKEWIMETKFDRLGCFAYSHEENTHAYSLVDDVSPKIKQERINSVMEIQSQISLELNQKKINQVYKCVIDRKEGINYIGRTEFDSPDVDNEVLVDASKYYLKIGDFVNLKIIDCTEFDLYAIPNEKL
jgi:ribosomal protein S12 methylthiotransferase|tara:strand:- start:436 stop:1269 length:834 start_codon:yes stop_codon:yes gene_type:complete